nr:uncharacterized protein LOC124814907 [Hydra vulgaris]
MEEDEVNEDEIDVINIIDILSVLPEHNADYESHSREQPPNKECKTHGKSVDDVLTRPRYVNTPPIYSFNFICLGRGEITNDLSRMPRNYNRKTEIKYRLEDLKKAIKDVKNKTFSLSQASLAYSVPKTTLFDYCKKEFITQPRGGRKCIFSDAQEKELKEYIVKCSQVFYGLTIEMVRKIAFKFAERNKLTHKFNRKTQLAGKDWYYSFIKRHSNISLRKPEPTSLNSINGFNATEVKMFFENLETLQKTYHFDPNHIYNVDETGISNVQRNSKILALKGQKQVGMATSAEEGSTTTVVCAFSASGKGGNADMLATVSDSGWINENLFVDWLNHFISFAKPTKDEPVLLILDNHEIHISFDCYLLCRGNAIVLLSLPPHTSHRMQPLDLTYFGPLKSAYNRECDIFMAANIGRRITQYEVVELFTKPFNRLSNIEKAANGFRAAGIYPLDPTKFNDFFPISIVTHETSLLDNIQSSESVQTSDTQAKSSEVLVNLSLNPSSVGLSPDVNIAPELVLNRSNQSISLLNIVSVPNLPKRKTRESLRKKHSTIITSSPMKDFLEDKQQKKSMKEQEVKQTAEKYHDPPTEDWIKCYKCKSWYHEKCTSCASTSRGFLCDFCYE